MRSRQTCTAGPKQTVAGCQTNNKTPGVELEARPTVYCVVTDDLDAKMCRAALLLICLPSVSSVQCSVLSVHHLPWAGGHPISCVYAWSAWVRRCEAGDANKASERADMLRSGREEAGHVYCCVSRISKFLAALCDGTAQKAKHNLHSTSSQRSGPLQPEQSSQHKRYHGPNKTAPLGVTCGILTTTRCSRQRR